MTATVRAPLRLGYQPALDGLRAVAVVLVLLYHGGVGWASGGFLGVDVFFVLSGFLITWLLVDEHAATGRVSIRSFYARRARRLFPALGVVLLAIGVYALTAAPAATLRELRGDVLATLGYVTNWRLVLGDRGYFDEFALPSPLTHTWSLAVEEQWYLLWPLVLGALLRWQTATRRDSRTAVVTGVLAVGSAVLMAALHVAGEDPSRVYYGTDTRAHQLLAGALLALVLARRRPAAGRSQGQRLALDVLGAACLAWVVYLAATIDDATTWLYEGGLVLVSAAIAVVLVAALEPAGRLRAVLSLAPLRWIGLISYGLYLWHYPTYVVLTSQRTGLDGTVLLLARLAATTALSVASFVVVERPARAARWSLPRVLSASSLAGATAAVAVVAAVAVHAPTTHDPFAPPVEVAEPETPADLASDPVDEPGQPSEPAPPEEPPVVTVPEGDLYAYDPARNPPPEIRPGEEVFAVLAVGDSTSLTLSLGHVQRSGDPPLLLWDKSSVGCMLFDGERILPGGGRSDGGPHCAPWRADRPSWVRQWDADVVTVLAGVWETYDKVVDGTVLEFGSAAFDRWFLDQLAGLARDLGAPGTPVVLLASPCYERAEDITGTDLPENDVERVRHLNGLYRQAAQRLPGVAFVDLFSLLCPDGNLQTEIDGVQVRHDDGVHFDSGPGSRVVWDWLRPQLVAIAERGD